MRNIIAGPTSEFFIYGKPGRWYKHSVSESDYNCYYRYEGDLIAEGDGATPEGTYASWKAAGFDSHSIVENPRLVNDENGFPIPADDSPVWKLGFKRIPVERIGPQGYGPHRSPD
jgi:hypothetical protein